MNIIDRMFDWALQVLITAFVVIGLLAYANMLSGRGPADLGCTGGDRRFLEITEGSDR